jgi:hypothetical protein
MVNGTVTESLLILASEEVVQILTAVLVGLKIEHVMEAI